MKPINTRICPSPTGFFHLGTARTAYLSYLVAKATGGKFILRIDDTDVNRNDNLYTQYILDVMDWLGLTPDMIIYQSDRLDFYNDLAVKLCDADLAYRIDDSKAIALKLPLDMPTTWNDLIAGDIKINDGDLKLIDGLILIKSDGYPTYNFCSIVDDIDLGIDWVMRGTDHISNTSKQVAIIQALKQIMDVHDIKFMHIGLIHHKVDGKDKKMSKRDGALSVLDFKNLGYDRDALLNYILKLGWAPRMAGFDSLYKTVSKDQAIDLIFQGNFKSSKSSFDLDKLNWLNKVYKKLNGS
jgi:glutamyl/glutaminyl-tRNA synthetase